MDGELLAEYRQGYAPFVPSKEYGYRNGQLLVTASNGDEQWLTNFVAQLYYRAGGYTGTDVQIRVNTLANAGAQGELPLREAAKTVVRQIYQASSLPAADFVAALYLGVLQRYGDPGGISYWTSIAQSDRTAVIEAFVTSGEFNERAQVLYGREVNEYDRTDKLTHYLYNVIAGRGATATERDARRAATDGANVFGQAAVVTNAKDFARSLFNGAEYAARNRSNSEFVSDLYYAFLRYAPDAGGWSYWTNVVNSNGRAGVMETFINAGPFDVQAGALYREVLWLVADHLGTPRMIAERSGQPAGIKHHDYLPFGEELFNGISGRDASHGYGAADSARQQFTAYERDDETGLDYAQARYYSSAMGRFISVDPLLASAKNAIPQTWNRFSYTMNNPLRYIDPTGECSAPALAKGQVGICIEAFISTPRIGPLGIANGNGRDIRGDGNNPALTAKIQVQLVLTADEKGVSVTSHETTTGSSEVLGHYFLAASSSEYTFNYTRQEGSSDFGTTSLNVTGTGKNGVQNEGEIYTAIGDAANMPLSSSGNPLATIGRIMTAAAPAGTIDFNVNFTITGNGQVQFTGGETRGYPTYAAYSYQNIDGNTVTTEHFILPENNIEDLAKPMRPIPRN